MAFLVEENSRIENIKLLECVEKNQITSGKSPTPFLRVMSETFPMLIAPLR